MSVAVAWSGLATARELQRRCGVPYVVGRPWCVEDARVLAELVRKAASGEAQGNPLCLWNEEREATISVAELANSLETAATGEAATGTPKTTCDGTTDAREAVGGTEIGESELIAWAHKNPGFTWVGDPLFERIPAFVGRSAAMLPHEATSSTLYADLTCRLAGDTALSHAQKGIMERCHQKTQAE